MRAALVMLLVSGAVLAGESDRNAITAAVDVTAVAADSELDSWLHGGNGKLRFDENHDGLQFARAFLDYRGRLAETVNLRATVNVGDTYSHRVDLTEAYLEWRPVPRNAWRLRSRVGAFYPKMSLENTDAGWSNAYGLSSSAINTWLGEELRIFGAELRATRRFARWPGQQLSLEGGVYYGNDPTGALLTWRGWDVHDRQTGITSKLPTPPVSAISPWNPGGEPLKADDPFVEVDHKPGFYVAGEWQWTGRARLKVFHYDNHGDPEASNSSGDYAWQTWFDHVGGEVALPWRLGLLGQWIKGSTRMGPDLGPWRVQDVDFEASYLTLTRSFGRHRLAVRYEWFDLDPYNDPAGYTNKDDGNAFAASYLFDVNEHWRLGAEYMQIASQHCNEGADCEWVEEGLPRTTREDTFWLTVRWRFDAQF